MIRGVGAGAGGKKPTLARALKDTLRDRQDLKGKGQQLDLIADNIRFFAGDPSLYYSGDLML